MFILKKSNAENNIHIESPLRHQISNANIENHKIKVGATRFKLRLFKLEL